MEKSVAKISPDESDWLFVLMIWCCCMLLGCATHTQIYKKTTVYRVARQNYTTLNQVVRLARLVSAHIWNTELIEKYDNKTTTGDSVAILLFSVAC